MDSKTPKSAAGNAPESREDRLKAALKANIARRKAQARARARSAGAADLRADNDTNES